MNGSWRFGPTHVDFNVTNGCNLACAHCHSSSGSRLTGELSTDEVLAAIDGLHRMGVMRIAIAGGEPFIRRDIVEILSHSCALPGWHVAVITNGMFLDERTVAELAARCPGLTVNVSIEGSTAAQFGILRAQRGRRSDIGTLFSRITAGIGRLVAAGVTTAVNMTLCRPTLQDAIPTYRYGVDELGVNAVLGIKFFPGGYGKVHREAFDIPYAEWSEFFAELTQRRLAGDLAGLQVSVPAPWEFYLPLISAGIDVPAAERAWGYSAPLRTGLYADNSTVGDTSFRAEMAISGDGTVYPSVLFVGVPGAELGNLRQRSLHDIWHDENDRVGVRRLVLEDIQGGCHSCPLRGTCGGGSRARAYADLDSIAAPDLSCPLIHAHEPLTRPSGAEAQRSVDADDEPSDMIVFGSGPSAVRLLNDCQTAQLRVNGHIINFDEISSRRLVAATSGPASVTDRASDELLREVVQQLRGLGASQEAIRQIGQRAASVEAVNA